MSQLQFLEQLEGIIRQRISEGDADSYTLQLAASGTRRIAQKVGEEGVEVALAAVTGKPEDVLSESADLLYHLLVLLQDRQLRLADVAKTLEARHAG